MKEWQKDVCGWLFMGMFWGILFYFTYLFVGTRPDTDSPEYKENMRLFRKHMYEFNKGQRSDPPKYPY